PAGADTAPARRRKSRAARLLRLWAPMDGSSHLEAKLLYRRLDSLLGALDVSRPGKEIVVSFLQEAFRTLKEDLRLRAAALYAEGREGFTLVKTFGLSRSAAPETLE